MKTGRVHVIRHVRHEEQLVPFYRQAVLLREGNDRFSLYDPAAENELARGMTRDFVTMLLSRGWLIYVKEVIV